MFLFLTVRLVESILLFFLGGLWPNTFFIKLSSSLPIGQAQPTQLVRKYWVQITQLLEDPLIMVFKPREWRPPNFWCERESVWVIFKMRQCWRAVIALFTNDWGNFHLRSWWISRLKNMIIWEESGWVWKILNSFVIDFILLNKLRNPSVRNQNWRILRRLAGRWQYSRDRVRWDTFGQVD